MPRAQLIKFRKGSAAPTAADFQEAEPAWDSTGKRLYVKAADGTMVDAGLPPGSSVGANGLQLPRLGLNTPANSLFHLAANGAAMVRHQSVTISGSTYTFDVGLAGEFTCSAAINGATTFALSNHDQLPAAVGGVGWRTRLVISFTWTSGTITFSATGYTFSQASVSLVSGQTYNAILTITSGSTVIGVQYTAGR